MERTWRNLKGLSSALYLTKPLCIFVRLRHARDLHELGKMFIKSAGLLPRPKSHDGNMQSVVAAGAAAALGAAANGAAAPGVAAQGTLHKDTVQLEGMIACFQIIC